MEIFSNYEKRLLDLLGFKAIKIKDSYAIVEPSSNETNVIKTVGFIDEKKESDCVYSHMKIKLPNLLYDNKRNVKDDNLETYEFFVIGDNHKLVTTYLSLGDTVKLGFMDDREGVRSLTISDSTLDLTFSSSTRNKRTCEQVIVKGDSSSDIKKYFGTSYSYQLTVSPKNKELEANDAKTYSLNFEASPENVYQVNLISKYPTGIMREENHLKEGITIRDAIKKDEAGLEAFDRFRFYANKVLPFKKDIMEILFAKANLKDDVFALFVKDLISFETIPENSMVIRLSDDTLFSLTLDSNREYPRARVHGRIIMDLKTIYPFGYIESGNLGEFIFDDSNYIFKLKSNGEIDRVFDYINRIEVFDPDDKKRIYKEYKEQKLLEKK